MNNPLKQEPSELLPTPRPPRARWFIFTILLLTALGFGGWLAWRHRFAAPTPVSVPAIIENPLLSVEPVTISSTPTTTMDGSESENNSEKDTEKTRALVVDLYPEKPGYYDLTDKGVWTIEVDYVQDCLSEPFEETLKLILSDGNCLPGTTIEELITEFEGGTWNISRLCPAQPFGYGSGYCYFRNQNPQIRALKIKGDIHILEIASPYDPHVLSRNLSLMWLKDKIVAPRARLDTIFELEVSDGWVRSITKPYISAE